MAKVLQYTSQLPTTNKAFSWKMLVSSKHFYEIKLLEVTSQIMIFADADKR